jgi:vacuolar-type H+-ATPase subunit I/STV1
VHQECPPQVTGEAEPLGPKDISHIKPLHQLRKAAKMQRQRGRSQMKEMEESRQLDIEFKTTFIRLLKNLLKTSEELSETFKDLNENTTKMEKDQSEIKHTLSEIKNIQKFNSRLKDPKNQTKDLKHEETKNTQPEKRIQKYEDSVRSL